MIIYIVSEQGMITFSSPGNLYSILKNILITINSFLLDKADKICILKNIESQIDALLKVRDQSNVVPKSTTSYNKKFKERNLILYRKKKDMELLSLIDLFDFIKKSEEINCFELPSFDKKMIDILSTLKNKSVDIKDIDNTTLQTLKKYNLILIKGNLIILKDVFKKIIFFM